MEAAAIENRKAIEEELNRIAARNGGVIEPEKVVERARNPRSPLHSQFQWDDTEAAQQWRLEQARRLIRSVQVISTTSTRTFAVAKYVRDPRKEAGEQGYVAIVDIKDNEAIALDALAYECTRAAAALERAVDVADALGLSGRVNELLKGVCVIRKEAESRRASKRAS